MNREDWANAFLRYMGWPTSRRNRISMIAWIAAEGGMAHWNPLNSTQKAWGSTDYNAIGVQNYVTLESGLEATAKTLEQWGKGYFAIRHCLKRAAQPEKTLRAVKRSRWGTFKDPLGPTPHGMAWSVRHDYDTYASIFIG